MLGKSKKHMLAHGDILGRCPQCFSNDVQKIGVLSVSGMSNDASKCNTCNSVFSGADGGIKSLKDEAAGLFNSEAVGFVSSSLTGITATTVGSLAGSATTQMVSGTNYQLSGNAQLGYPSNGIAYGGNIAYQPPTPPDHGYKFDQMNNTLNSILSYLSTLNFTIENLVKQNNSLMEKLATDPLVGIKKAVNQFNLE